MAAVPEDRSEEIFLLLIHRSHGAGQDQVGKADDRVERGTQLVRHVGEKLVLELGRALQLGVLRRQGPFVLAAFLQNVGPVEPDDRLLSQGPEELEVVGSERLSVVPVVNAHRSNDHVGGPKGDDRDGPKGGLDSREGVAPGIGIHVVADQRLLVGDDPSGKGVVHRKERPVGRLEGAVGGDHFEKPALLDHQGDHPGFGLKQVRGGLGDLLEQGLNVGALEQGRRQVGQPVQLPAPRFGRFVRRAVPLLLLLGDFLSPPEGDQRQQSK